MFSFTKWKKRRIKIQLKKKIQSVQLMHDIFCAQKVQKIHIKIRKWCLENECIKKRPKKK